jgi:hypothetical protein
MNCAIVFFYAQLDPFCVMSPDRARTQLPTPNAYLVAAIVSMELTRNARVGENIAVSVRCKSVGSMS